MNENLKAAFAREDALIVENARLKDRLSQAPIVQAKALAARWREKADRLDDWSETAGMARETADLLEQLIAELERP